MRRKDNVGAWITLLNERAATWQRPWRKRFLRRVRRRNDKMAGAGVGFGVCKGRFFVAGAPPKQGGEEERGLQAREENRPGTCPGPVQKSNLPRIIE